MLFEFEEIHADDLRSEMMPLPDAESISGEMILWIWGEKEGDAQVKSTIWMQWKQFLES